jgi:hypothetical protein
LCDLCGDDWYENGVHHFEDLEAARKYLVDERVPSADDLEYDPYIDNRWQIEDDKPVLCSNCRNQAECETSGHPWSEWSEGSLVSIRYCQRCNKTNTNIADVVEQMTAEGGPTDG